MNINGMIGRIERLEQYAPESSRCKRCPTLRAVIVLRGEVQPPALCARCPVQVIRVVRAERKR
jgi:hypothetical protein